MLLCVSVAADWLPATKCRCASSGKKCSTRLDAVSPLIDDVRPGLAFLDMHGIAGDARTWMAQTRTVLAHFGCALRLGAGPNKIAALAAAYVADGSICPPGAESEMLAPLPLALLDIEPAIDRTAGGCWASSGSAIWRVCRTDRSCAVSAPRRGLARTRARHRSPAFHSARSRRRDRGLDFR